MPVTLRAVLFLILVPIAAFFFFGLLDSGEAGPKGAVAYRTIYGFGIAGCFAAMFAVLFVKRS